MAITRPKGTNDLLPPGSPKLSPVTSAAAHVWLIETARRVLERAGAQRIDTPIFEEAELVKRGVGDSTDIVRKEMFTVYYFGDHGGFILRPEGTAAIVRAYLQNGLKQLPAPLKLWTSGPIFRAENVQKGRYRQFHQVDYEVLGSADPLVDAEAIALMVDVVRELGLKEVRVKLGSIGDPADREAYNAYLRELFAAHVDRLSDDSKDRLTRNPMRILDSKSESDQALIAELSVKPMLDFLGEEARAHFEAVQGYLKDWDVPYDLDPSIVRGLDYYRRTAWELHHEGVGAKSALGGGGRYDGLAEILGGQATPGIGWAFGVERLLLALEAEGIDIPSAGNLDVYIVALKDEYINLAAKVAQRMRAKRTRAEFAYSSKNPSAAVRDAARRSARFLVLIGDDEFLEKYITLRDLKLRDQYPIPLSTLKIILDFPNQGNLLTKGVNIQEIVKNIKLFDSSSANTIGQIVKNNDRFSSKIYEQLNMFDDQQLNIFVSYKEILEKLQEQANGIIEMKDVNWSNFGGSQ